MDELLDDTIMNYLIPYIHLELVTSMFALRGVEVSFTIHMNI